MVAVGELSEDFKTAYSSYSSPAAFGLQRLEARSLGQTVERQSARPTDIMYTVVWLACAKVLALQSIRKPSTRLSWQHLCNTNKMLAPSKEREGKSPAYLVSHGLEAIQKVTAEKGRGLKACAPGRTFQSQPGRASNTGKSYYLLGSFLFSLQQLTSNLEDPKCRQDGLTL